MDNENIQNPLVYRRDKDGEIRDYSVVLTFGDWKNMEKKRRRRADLRAGRGEVLGINPTLSSRCP